MFIGYCNTVDGQDDEFNDWYWNVHFKDITDLPGVISGRRFTSASAQLGDIPLPFKYLGLFEVECDDPQAFIAELGARAGSGQIKPSSTVALGSSLVLWQMMPQS